jgi:hypothetical protein
MMKRRFTMQSRMGLISTGSLVSLTVITVALFALAALGGVIFASHSSYSGTVDGYAWSADAEITFTGTSGGGYGYDGENTSRSDTSEQLYLVVASWGGEFCGPTKQDTDWTDDFQATALLISLCNTAWFMGGQCLDIFHPHVVIATESVHQALHGGQSDDADLNDWDDTGL